MTPDRLRAILDQLGWSQRELARRIGYDDRQVRRWTAGAATIPESVAEWLEELSELFSRVPTPTRYTC